MGERDTRGRFARGNQGGPGRPVRQTEREYVSVLLGRCSLEDWEEIVTRAVKDAKAGDAKAREWLAKYLIGNPEASAPSLTSLAVEAEAGIDPLANEILLARVQERR